MQTEHINNLISLVADTVDRIHRSTDDLEFVEASLHMRIDLYGDLPREVINHIGACLTGIKRQVEQEEYDDYYSDFLIQ